MSLPPSPRLPPHRPRKPRPIRRIADRRLNRPPLGNRIAVKPCQCSTTSEGSGVVVCAIRAFEEGGSARGTSVPPESDPCVARVGVASRGRGKTPCEDILPSIARGMSEISGSKMLSSRFNSPLLGLGNDLRGETRFQVNRCSLDRSTFSCSARHSRSSCLSCLTFDLQHVNSHCISPCSFNVCTGIVNYTAFIILIFMNFTRVAISRW